MIGAIDKEYEDRIQKALIETIMRESLDPGTNVVLLRSGEIMQAMLRIIAFHAATSEVSDTPRKTREFCQRVAKRLQLYIAGAKDAQTSEGLDFLQVVRESDWQ